MKKTTKLQAERKSAMEDFEKCLDAVTQNHVRYLAWQHYGKLSRTERKADKELNRHYRIVKKAIEQTLKENADLTVAHLKRHLRTLKELNELTAPVAPDPVA